MKSENLRQNKTKREVGNYRINNLKFKNKFHLNIGAMVIVDQIKQRETMRIR